MSSVIRRCCFLFLALAVAGFAPMLRAQRERLPLEDLEVVEQRWPGAKRTATSLRYLVLKEGDTKGPSPTSGMMVATLYKGMLLDGTVFDQTQDAKAPFRTRIGRENLIAAWEEALQKMHRGDKWLLIVPYELGYGTRGKPPSIPSRATLVFELELVDFGPN